MLGGKIVDELPAEFDFDAEVAVIVLVVDGVDASLQWGFVEH